MFGGRRKLPVVAEIAGPASAESRAWSLRREDFEQVAGVLARMGERRVVMVTGSEDLVRVLAIGLAGAACAAARRAVLVECDLARPRLAADLGLELTPGLHEYLRWEATAAEILQPLALAGSAASEASEPLVCVAAGRLASDSATLLGLQSFRHMAAKLRGAYDLVVLSAPALGGDHAGLAAIAPEADGLLAGIAPRQATGSDGKATRSALAKLPATTIGAVLINE